MKYKDLTELYNYYLIKFKENGIHPHPSQLLALLLLEDKDRYFPMQVPTIEFYSVYKEDINKKINKIITDFNLSKEKLDNYLEESGKYFFGDTYEDNIIWIIFFKGVNVMHKSIINNPNYNSIQLYNKNLKYWKQPILKSKFLKKKKVI